MAVVQNPSAVFSVHFDGPITQEHHVSLRVLSRTYENMQRAIDRAYLIEKYGAVYKHARLKGEDYAETEFLALYPREGGIILDAIRNAGGGRIIDRISDAIRTPFERAVQGGLDEAAAIREQLERRRQYVRQMGAQDVQTFQGLVENPPAGWQQAFSQRSIVKEIDQLASQVTPKELEGSSVEIVLFGDHARARFDFTPEIAVRFHEIVAAREVGPAVIVNARIRDLDRGNKFSKPKAKILNLDTGREAILHLNGMEDFYELHPYHTADNVRIFASPYVEAGGFDLMSGDLIFVAVV